MRRFHAFFEQNGYHQWINANTTDDEKRETKRKVFVNINGSVSLGYAKESIKILKSDSNYKGDQIRLVLGKKDTILYIYIY